MPFVALRISNRSRANSRPTGSCCTAYWPSTEFSPDSSDLLYILNELWNRDKHRLLNFCVAYTPGVKIVYGYPDGRVDERLIHVPRNVKDGTELFRDGHPGAGVKVIAYALIRNLVFNGGLLDQQPVLLLAKLVQFAECLIDSLAATI
jgi:hypothetical protein